MKYITHYLFKCKKNYQFHFFLKSNPSHKRDALSLSIHTHTAVSDAQSLAFIPLQKSSKKRAPKFLQTYFYSCTDTIWHLYDLYALRHRV